MTIRVTPIGGEPLELPEDTEAVSCDGWEGGAVTVERHWHWGDKGCVLGASNIQQVRTIRNLYSLLADGGSFGGSAFVHIGDAWPLCEIETWRQRAERLEAERLPAHVLTFAADLLEKAADEFGNHGCNEMEWPAYLDAEKREIFAVVLKHMGDEDDDPQRILGKRMAIDWLMMLSCARMLRGACALPERAEPEHIGFGGERCLCTAAARERLTRGCSPHCSCHSMPHDQCPDAQPCIGRCGRWTTAGETQACGYCAHCAADQEGP